MRILKRDMQAYIVENQFRMSNYRHRTFPHRTRTLRRPREQQKVNPTHHKRRNNIDRLYQRESSRISCLQTALTAQIHKRAWLPSRLKVTLVTRIFRPSTGRLRFLIHALWNVSYTCHLASHAMRTPFCYVKCSIRRAADAPRPACIVTQASFDLVTQYGKQN